MQVAKGAFVMLGMNTPTPTVFWNGKAIQNITSVTVDWELEEQRIKLRTSILDLDLAAELALAGISLKKEKRHE